MNHHVVRRIVALLVVLGISWFLIPPFPVRSAEGFALRSGHIA
jgi:hypothetical protein